MQNLAFKCANQTGEFYIKVLAIAEGRSIPPTDHLMLFDNGQWSNQLGRVTVRGQDHTNEKFLNLNTDPKFRFENGVYKFSGAEGGIDVEFENRVNASRYRYLTIETEETREQMGHWAGGQIYIYTPTAYNEPPEHWTSPTGPTNKITYGFWQVGPNWTKDNNGGIIKSQDGNITFDFRYNQISQDSAGISKRNPDFTNFLGFFAKSMQGFTVRRIYLHN